jgi:hypothetical protein
VTRRELVLLVVGVVVGVFLTLAVQAVQHHKPIQEANFCWAQSLNYINCMRDLGYTTRQALELKPD